MIKFVLEVKKRNSSKKFFSLNCIPLLVELAP